MRRPLGVILVLVAAGSLPAQETGQVIDVRAARPLAGNSFEALWAAYRKAEQAADADNAPRILREIRRLRIERNIRSLETLALALVSQGLDSLRKGDWTRAEEHFRSASALDPHLPDAYYGLALADLRKGPLGVVQATQETIAGVTARWGTSRGRFYLRALLVPVALLTLFVSVGVFSFVLLIRYGSLLLHDLEEWLGPRRSPHLALALCGLLLFVPLVTFQGWGWLPLWWLALLFMYLSRQERIVAVAALLGALFVGPAVKSLEAHIRTEQNPLYRAAMQAVEKGPDARAIADLEAATRQHKDDRDLLYLLALLYKKAGRYDDAASLYRDVLTSTPNDAVALNNLANLEFARGEFPAAIARYRQAMGSSPDPVATATCRYNVSLAHLQRFEYQPAQEARAEAARLRPDLIEEYDRLWRYERGDFAVVDLGLTESQVRAKFAGLREGVQEKNVAGLAVRNAGSGSVVRNAGNRFTAFLALFALMALGLPAWRGAKGFTTRCPKCGTPFCNKCRLGAGPGGLCTQCHHLFVVRDGVSGPARNQKLRDVQKEETGRARIFRALSLVSPGAGFLYVQKTLPGMALVIGWYLVLAFLILTGRLLPVTEAPAVLETPWAAILAGVLLLGLYVAANRRPDRPLLVPVGRLARSGQAS